MYVAPPPDTTTFPQPERILEIVRSPPSDHEYLHWDKLRHLTPPSDLTHEEWWWAIQIGRMPTRRQLPLVDKDGRHFVFSTPDEVLRALHFVDQRCAGEIAMPAVVTADDQARQHFLVNSLMEEAIRSSQLEGATTSRLVARELLRTGRPPKDRSERMIVNNYRALGFIRDQIGDSLTPAHVLELHRLITDGTLDDSRSAGRLQTPSDIRVAVYDRSDGSLVHQPPPADQLPWRLEKLCEFANGVDDPDAAFIHPVVRSILVHFWLAYDHPFQDGNGRTARLLFYWSMRRSGYWLTEYLSISKILREAPAKYTRAFLLAETDGGDTTYFLIYQLGVIRRAVDELRKYLERKIRDVRRVEQAIRGARVYNHRQLALLSDAVRNPDRVYTFQSHARSHNVTVETARTDLQELARAGLLTQSRSGRKYVYFVPDDLAARLAAPEGAAVTPAGFGED